MDTKEKSKVLSGKTFFVDLSVSEGIEKWTKGKERELVFKLEYNIRELGGNVIFTRKKGCYYIHDLNYMSSNYEKLYTLIHIKELDSFIESCKKLHYIENL